MEGFGLVIDSLELYYRTMWTVNEYQHWFCEHLLEMNNNEQQSFSAIKTLQVHFFVKEETSNTEEVTVGLH